MTIDVLPDEMLVEAFFYVNLHNRFLENPWHALVHVCRRWRYLVFASPRRLNLLLEYRGHRPLSDVLDIWPVLPVMLISSPGGYPKSFQRRDNVIAALESEHSNRICEINILNMIDSCWERFAATMQKLFPELTHLHVRVWPQHMVPVLPDSFLGGSAPRLRILKLTNFPFPSIPKLLLSANGLIILDLWDIPDLGYISPDAMASGLSVMTRLETLRLGFRSPPSRPNPASRPLPPPARFVLPALTDLEFGGAYKYLEDLLARIDTPLLYGLRIRFLMDLNFLVPQLHRLICHTEEFKPIDHAEVLISDESINLNFYPKSGAVNQRVLLEIQVNCRESEWQLSSLAQICSSSFPLISTLEQLTIAEGYLSSSSHWKDDMEDAQWVELLEPFTALKDLYLKDEIARHLCGALQQLSEEQATEVLPALLNIFVDGSFKHIQETIKPFVAARQLSGHPVSIDHWRR